MDGGAWWATVHGVAKSRTRLSDFTFTFFMAYGLPRRCSSKDCIVKTLPAHTGDTRVVGSIPGLERSFGGGHGNPLQYSYLENAKDKEAWRAKVHKVTKSKTQLK